MEVSEANQKRQILNRLSIAKTNLFFDRFYLFYKFFYIDLQTCISKYVKGNLLDIGCGNKPYLEWYKSFVKSSIGCDIAQSNLNKVDVICPTIKLDFEKNSFETVFCTQVLEHIDELEQSISEMHRVLKIDGICILSTNFLWPIHEKPFDYFRFTEYGLSFLFEKKFKIIEIIPNGGKWASTGILILHSVYSTLDKQKGIKKFLMKFFLLLIFFKPFINSFFYLLDAIEKDYSITTNYIVIAKKTNE